MHAETDPLSDLALPDQANVNDLCDQFEDALQQGLRPRVEDFLADTAGRVREALLRELLLLECERTLERGDDVDQTDLASRFPNHADAVREATEVARRNHLVNMTSRLLGSGDAPDRLFHTFGRFRLLAVVGHGSFGTVFRAEDTKNGNEVALKVPHLATLVTPELRGRFFREARAAAALQHPGIVHLLDVGEEGLVCYIASEYVPGTTLAAWLRSCAEKQERIPFETAARLLVSLATAMQHAHEQGVYHCDLKPANILLRDGRPTKPVIADFGLARVVGEGTKLTLTGQVLGTPAYMAPEQAFGPRRPLGPRPDVYGLGAILYEILTGRPPFQAPTPLEIMLQKRNGEPISPRVLSPHVPRDLETITLKCLEERPERRYASAGALATDLDRWLNGERIQARPVGLLGRGWRSCRRRPFNATLVVALTGSVLVGVGGITLQWRRAEAARRGVEVALEATEAARRDAEANEAALHEMLQLKMLQLTVQPLPESRIDLIGASDLAVLLEAESHFKEMLARKPADAWVRTLLVRVEERLSKIYRMQGQDRAAAARLQFVHELWETLRQKDPENPSYPDCLAVICVGEADLARRSGRIEESIRLMLQADDVLQEYANAHLADENLAARASVTSIQLLELCKQGVDCEEASRACRREIAIAEESLSAHPSEPMYRQRLAFRCLLTAELCLSAGQHDDALSYLQSAYDQYSKLAQQEPDNVGITTRLSMCCSRLAAEQPSEVKYLDAELQLEKVAQRLGTQKTKNAGLSNPIIVLLEPYCDLARYKWKAKAAAQAEQIFKDRIEPLLSEFSETASIDTQGIVCLQKMLRASDLLREQKAIALAVARQASALAERLAGGQSPEPKFQANLAECSISISATLCRLGDPASALRLAEQGRTLSERLSYKFPSEPRYGHALSDAWQRIGKARWELSRRIDALAAFQEAATVERRVVKQAPAVRLYKEALSRCYDRLSYHLTRAGDRAGAAAALEERQRLWPDNPKELQDVARGLRELADTVGKDRDRLSAEEQAEKNRYRAASKQAEEDARTAATKLESR